MLELEALSTAYRDAFSLAETALKSLALEMNFVECSLEKLQPDVLSCKEIGFSFVNDKRNGLKKKTSDFFRNLLGSAIFQSRFIESFENDQLVWELKAISEWFKQSAQFLDILIFLIHLSSGQPARAPELTTYRIINGSVDHGHNHVGYNLLERL